MNWSKSVFQSILKLQAALDNFFVSIRKQEKNMIFTKCILLHFHIASVLWLTAQTIHNFVWPESNSKKYHFVSIDANYTAARLLSNTCTKFMHHKFQISIHRCHQCSKRTCIFPMHPNYSWLCRRKKVLMRLMHNARLFAQPCKHREREKSGRQRALSQTIRPNAIAARTEQKRINRTHIAARHAL